MAAIGMLGKGTILEFGTVSGTYGSKLANLIDCTIPGWMCDVIDVTHNDSSDSPNREKLPGLHDHEPLTATFIFTRAEYIERLVSRALRSFGSLPCLMQSIFASAGSLTRSVRRSRWPTS